MATVTPHYDPPPKPYGYTVRLSAVEMWTVRAALGMYRDNPVPGMLNAEAAGRLVKELIDADQRVYGIDSTRR
jgi:hypothetical protein